MLLITCFDTDAHKIQLGVPSGVVHGVEIDTTFFNGNHAPAIAVEGTFIDGSHPDGTTAVRFPL